MDTIVAKIAERAGLRPKYQADLAPKGGPIIWGAVTEAIKPPFQRTELIVDFSECCGETADYLDYQTVGTLRRFMKNDTYWPVQSPYNTASAWRSALLFASRYDLALKLEIRTPDMQWQFLRSYDVGSLGTNGKSETKYLRAVYLKPNEYLVALRDAEQCLKIRLN